MENIPGKNRFKTRSERCREQGIRQQDLVGKTISGVVAHPGVSGRGVVIMLQFDDGSCLEFMTPASERALKNLIGANRDGRRVTAEPQLALAV